MTWLALLDNMLVRVRELRALMAAQWHAREREAKRDRRERRKGHELALAQDFAPAAASLDIFDALVGGASVGIWRMQNDSDVKIAVSRWLKELPQRRVDVELAHQFIDLQFHRARSVSWAQRRAAAFSYANEFVPAGKSGLMTRADGGDTYRALCRAYLFTGRKIGEP